MPSEGRWVSVNIKESSTFPEEIFLLILVLSHISALEQATMVLYKKVSLGTNRSWYHTFEIQKWAE